MKPKEILMSPTQETVLGEIKISPALSPKEAEYLNLFLNTHHYIDTTQNNFGLYSTNLKPPQEYLDNKPQDGQFIQHFRKVVDALISNQAQEFVPSLSSPLLILKNPVTDSYDSITINRTHVTRQASARWFVFIIEHFFKKNALAKLICPEKFSFFIPHDLNGEIWVKAGRTWDTQKIIVSKNEVFLCFASVPIRKDLAENNNDIISVNFWNHTALFKNKNSQLLGKTFYSKQYHEMSIQQIAEYNDITTPDLQVFSPTETLEKIIFQAKLNSKLTSKQIDTKQSKI